MCKGYLPFIFITWVVNRNLKYFLQSCNLFLILPPSFPFILPPSLPSHPHYPLYTLHLQRSFPSSPIWQCPWSLNVGTKAYPNLQPLCLFHGHRFLFFSNHSFALQGFERKNLWEKLRVVVGWPRYTDYEKTYKTQFPTLRLKTWPWNVANGMTVCCNKNTVCCNKITVCCNKITFPSN